MPDSTQTVQELEKSLMDTSQPLFLRYRAMFALRDLASPPDLPTAVPAVHALAKGFADRRPYFARDRVRLWPALPPGFDPSPYRSIKQPQGS